MIFFLDTKDSETTGEAVLSLGNEPGGEIVCRLPYKTDKDRLRARYFLLVPLALTELDGIRDLWWYHGPAEYECPQCHHKSQIPGASDAQIGRLERLRWKLYE